jgi:hypothetical protein
MVITVNKFDGQVMREKIPKLSLSSQTAPRLGGRVGLLTRLSEKRAISDFTSPAHAAQVVTISIIQFQRVHLKKA